LGRGVAFRPDEDRFLVENATSKTAEELFKMHETLRVEKMWPARSEKSLARRVERLREEEQIGMRDEETRRKAYFDRNRFRGR
jgi:hypothetical protein